MPNSVSIQTVAERTGLTPHAIRAWERRYGAIEPARSKGRHRMYSDSDVRRLALLARATRAGRSIGRIARLDDEQLSAIVAESLRSTSQSLSGCLDGTHRLAEAKFFENALQAILALDTQSLDDTFQAAQVKLGDQGLLRRLITPLAREVGGRWRTGQLTAAHEHFFTAMSKVFLWNLTRQYQLDAHAPKIVVGTPAGQIHDLGAMIVAAVAANNGWRVAYVGASLPAFELAGAVQTVGAKAIALSIVYPDDDPKLEIELSKLGRLLPDNVHFYVGGRASSFYLPALKRCGARVLSSLEELDEELDTARRTSGRPLQP
jgi:MerR family transcriptional regulator, light-induced transcriptional regulator